MTIKQAAQQLRLSEQLVRVWIQNGTCPFGYIVRPGDRKTYYINEAELKKFINGESTK
jgi:excisionase family DNA binding protein